MKTIYEFLADLKHQKVKLWLEGDQLRLKAPKGVLTKRIVQQIRARKAEILLFFQSNQDMQKVERPPIEPTPRDGVLPLSYAQQRLWFLEQLEGPSPIYNVPTAYRLTGSLHVTALEQAIHEVIRRHEVLRTTFSTVEGQPVQKIAPPNSEEGEEGCLAVYDLQQFNETEQKVELNRLLAEEARRPFNLAEGPLLRVTLYQLGKTQEVLLLNMHHIISDGWSLGLWWQELDTLYRAFAAGKPSPLPELPVQYADFAQWQRSWLTGEVLEKQLSYWKQQLAGAPTLLELPTDHARPPVQTFNGRFMHFYIAPQLAEALRILSRRTGTTLFMSLYGAFAVLLSRYSRQEDIVIGTSIANRHYQEIEPLIGFFVNTLPLRSDLSGNPTFEQLLAQVRQVTLDAYAHQDIPFEQLVGELVEERNLSHPPLFQVMFELQDAFFADNNLGELSLELLELENISAKFDLNVMLFDGQASGSLAGILEYNTDLFEQASMERMIGHYLRLLEGIVQNAQQPINQLPLLTETERHQLLVEWNDTYVPCPTDQCFHELFEAQVARTPNAPALNRSNDFSRSGPGTTVTTYLSYGELNERANQLAHHLRALGVKPEVVVGVCMERCPETVISLLAIFKAGGVYIPLDPALPQERLSYMLTNSDALVILTKSQYASRLTDHNAQTVYFDADEALIAEQPTHNPLNLSTPQNLAYVIYTSGSTGLPKGAMVEQQGMVNHLYTKIIDLKMSAEDRLAETAPQSFDISIWQFLSALLVGGAVHIFDDETVRNPAQLLARTEAEKITILEVVPSLFRFMLDELETLGPNRPEFSALRWLMLTGEALPPHLCREWFPYYPDIPLINAYGPTECSDDVTHHAIYEPPPPNAVTVPIGRAVPNMRLYILDPTMQPVPIGVLGELYVGGIGVGRGYLNDPERTANAFMDDPFVPTDRGQPQGVAPTGKPQPQGIGQPHRRFYKTGDLVRYRPNGTIEFLGRLDHQVKIRGHRIELGEIEGVLAKHPAVRQSLVIAKENGPADYSLVAYVARNRSNDFSRSGPRTTEVVTTPAPSVTELRHYLSQTLPDYMIPAAFVTLDAFPLTPNGKVDRKALPEPTITSEQETTLRPQTQSEEVVANIWAEVLGVERVGREDNFFELGGHSLLAIQVISRLREAFRATPHASVGQQASRVELSVRMVFESPTVAELAVAIQQEGSGLLVPPPIVPQRMNGERLRPVFPLSFAQQRLWFLDQLEGPSATYNIPFAFQLTASEAEPLQIPALQEAINKLIQRHEVLRTSFPNQDGLPVQQIHPDVTLPLTIVDLQEARSNDFSRSSGRGTTEVVTTISELEGLLEEEAKRPFDLAQGPLLRVTLYRLSELESVLQLTIHHIISDDWSREILTSELDALYQAAISGQAAALPELAVQYADFSLWQRQWLSGEVLDKQLDYWQKQLTGASILLKLPTDHARPLVQTFNGQVERFELPQSLIEPLRALSRQAGTSLFMALYGAFAVLMGRYSGQEEFVIGTPIANRHYREIEPLIGFFLNTLPLRTDLSGDPSFADLLKRVRQTTLSAYSHQDIPFEQLVEELAVERNLSHSPLFQVMFVWLERPQPLALGPMKMSMRFMPTVAAKFDLTLFLGEKSRDHALPTQSEPADDGLWGMIEYNTDLFERATIERMIGHFEQLLTSIAADSAQSVNQLPLLTENERQQLLFEWNATESAYPMDKCLHHLFEEQAERSPNAVAVTFAEQQLTYRELNQVANQLAHHLQALGVGPDIVVGLCLSRSLEMIVGVLAILKAGGAYAPLDPAYPQERLSFMLADAQIKVLLTEERLHTEIGPLSSDIQVLTLDTMRDQLAGESTENLESLVSLENLLYVIYTSGSTGKPKGVAMPHRSLSNLVWWQQAQSQVSIEERTLQFSPISFDVSCQEIFSTLAFGGTLVLVDDETRRDGQALLHYLNEQQINRLFLPFVALQQLAEHAQLAPPPTLREVITAGEQLQTTEAIRRWFKQTNCTLHNQYGPTESHVVTAYTLPEAVDDWTTLPPIGRPVANAQTYILDPKGEPAAIGVVGELYLAGHPLARGYLHRPDLTEERFVPNPFGQPQATGQRQGIAPTDDVTGGVRLYKTGDLARYLPDGNIEFLGRADDQVKIRGFRVELGEIEARLTQHAAVQEAAVVAREDDGGNKRLVAYVVSEEPLSDLVSELRAHLKAQLPEYMVPAAFVMLDALPLTPSGKINRRALPAPERENFVTQSVAASLAPRTPTEEVLAAIWAEVLRVEQVGREDNFFDLGGHSLLATQIISRVREAFRATPHASVGQQASRVALPVRTLFEAPTIAQLADAISNARQAEAPLPVPPPIRPWAIPPSELGGVRGGQEEVPLSFAQQRLWFLSQMEGGSAMYNLPMGLRLSGALEISALQQALNEIVRRHDILRTSFPTVLGQPVQRIAPNLTVPLSIVDLQQLAGSEQSDELKRIMPQDAGQPFDLAEERLVRVTLYRLSQTDHVLLLNIHHTIWDGWSQGIFWKELDALYKAFSAGNPSPLPELPLQYADFAQWQRQWLQGEAKRRQLAYWQQQLADAPTLLQLPTDFPRPAVQSYNGQLKLFKIEAPLTAQLQALSRRCGVSLFMTLYGAFGVLMSRYSGQEDLVIGSPIANRHYQEIEPLIGFFVNTLTLRIDLSGNPSFEELLKRVRQMTLEAYNHQDIPFEQLVGELTIERNLSHSPLFQVMFAWQKIALGQAGLGDLQASQLEMESTISLFDLTIGVGEAELADGGGLLAEIEYNTDLFLEATIERMIGHFRQLLTGIVSNPAQQVKQLPLLTEMERQKLLVEWNSTETTSLSPEADTSSEASYGGSTTLCFHQLFEAQVKRTPDAVAVVYGSPLPLLGEGQGVRAQQLTYGQLNERANQLAHRLQAAGVGPDVLVGLSVERSLSMVVGLLGILKAGGTYVPLDPSYPAERLNFMLADTELQVLVTDENKLENELPVAHHLQVQVVRLSEAEMAQQATRNPVSGVEANHLAYIIYTSGSTGRPKGVLIEHGALANHCQTMQKLYKLTPKDSVLQFASLNFDVSLEQLLPPLLVGAKVVIGQLWAPTNFLQKVQEFGLSVMDLPPAYCQQLFDLWRANPALLGLLKESPLRLILVGGEAVPAELLSLWQQMPQKVLESVRLLNAYGPTEATITATLFELPLTLELANYRTGLPIGRPLPNRQAYILDHDLQPVPIGVPGELHLGGFGLARGYLNRPALTEEKFIPNPFGKEERLYKTGDLVRYLPDGMIQFLGRVDHQVKIRGFRIELGEIESVLKQHPAVKESVVIAREEKSGEKRLVAYVVPADSGPPLPTLGEGLGVRAVLRAHLKETLPAYMVPAAFVLLDSLPVTPNGKVNRRALPAPDEMQATQHYVSPQSHLEKAIATVWQEVLGLPKACPEGRGISVHDNFFEVGGHSLLAVQIHTKLQAILTQEITITDLFGYPTIASLAKYLSSKASAAPKPGKEGKIEEAKPTQPEQSSWEANQSRSEARRAALKQRVTRKPRRRNRSRR